jgi:hypothetical protein
MKIEISQNGIQRILMIPETETEKAFLKDLGNAKQTKVEIIDKPTPAMYGQISEGLLIETVNNE